jgi:hypothetical protein
MSDSKIGELRMAVGEQNILRLYVAVDEPIPMRVVESSSDFDCNPYRLIRRKLSLPVEPVAQ